MTWYRVFGGQDNLPEPADLALAGPGRFVVVEVVGDEAGWQRLVLQDGETIVELERWLVGEEGIRAELNSWAAVVESWGDGAEHAALMERIIQARQLVTLATSDTAGAVGLCRWLAERMEGVYQVDGEGFFTSQGAVVVAEA